MFFDFLKHRQFVSKIDSKAVDAALHRAQSGTTGHLGLLISHRRVSDPVAAAKRHFHKLGGHHASGRNAILIFVAPASRKFAVLGDTAIHEKAGEAAWNGIAAEMERFFQKEDVTAALLAGIDRAGALLAQYFPKK